MRNVEMGVEVLGRMPPIGYHPSVRGALDWVRVDPTTGAVNARAVVSGATDDSHPSILRTIRRGSANENSLSAGLSGMHHDAGQVFVSLTSKSLRLAIELYGCRGGCQSDAGVILALARRLGSETICLLDGEGDPGVVDNTSGIPDLRKSRVHAIRPSGCATLRSMAKRMAS